MPIRIKLGDIINGRKLVELRVDKRGKDWLHLFQCKCGNMSYLQLCMAQRSSICLKCENNRRRTFKQCNAKERGKLLSLWIRCQGRCAFNPSYKKLGIKFHKEWADEYKGFERFVEYVTQLPNWNKHGYHFDRINGKGNYEPGNVRFVTRQKNMENKLTRASVPSVIDRILNARELQCPQNSPQNGNTTSQTVK